VSSFKVSGVRFQVSGKKDKKSETCLPAEALEAKAGTLKPETSICAETSICPET
jgi:hypothetical protein